ATFKHAPAALLLPTGYMANLAVLTALAGPGDLVCLDKLNHASLIDAARATGATVRTFPHLHYARLERLLARCDEATRLAASPPRPPRRFIVTDTIFSMDGDAADLPALCDLADQYDATLIVDEAHATGVLGDTGAGLCEAQHVTHRVPIVVSTASKALGSLGGIVTASQPVIDTLINRARPLIYTTAVPPAQAAAIGAALEVIRDEPWRRQRLAQMSQQLRTDLLNDGWTLSPTDSAITEDNRQSAIGNRQSPAPIIPLIVQTPERALHLADHLQRAGFLAVAIRPPTVPPNTARVRLSLRADLTDDDLAQLRTALARFTPEQDA
ncbi:MAG: aminotransferase class I/II-fold pyridoxal phosphate-dependent enzyme, partial [Phycisphaeraceae bacterium]